MTDSTHRRGKVSEEHLQEAARLRELWNATYEERKAQGTHSQGAFGAEFGIGNQAAVGFFLNGKTALSLNAAVGFARGLRCAVADFSPRLAAKVDQVAELHGTRSADLHGDGWPFPNLDRALFDSLEDWQRNEIQGLVREKIKEFALGAAGKRTGNGR